VTDNGTLTQEASILNFAALNIRQAHERPEDMEEGGVMMVGLTWEQICEGLTIPKAQLRGSARSLRIVQDSNIPNVSTAFPAYRRRCYGLS
jgi:UDP-N-acetylglucosamine 2-epimerase